MPVPTESAIAVPSEDPKKAKKEDKNEDKDKEEGSSKQTNKDEEEGEELESNTSLYKPALESLRSLIRTSTSSMTSVPKPLKFLRPHYPDLQQLYETWPASDDKSLFADILSVLAMTYSDTQPRGTLRYRLLSASLRPADSPLADPGTWGHEYVRHLAAELGEEFVAQEQGELEDKPDEKKVTPIGTIEELRSLGKQCATFLLAHNAEPDAVDLLEELEIVDQITELVDDNTYGRVCQYMVRCVNLLPPPDDIAFLQTAHTIYVQQSKFPEALALAIRLGDPALVREDFNAPGNPLMKRQLGFLLARAQVPLHWLKNPEADENADFADDLPEDLLECLSNTRLSGHFRDFGKELGVQDAKSLEDVYKSHLEHTRPNAQPNVDSARGNLAGTFVNAFVNAGFGNDKLMVEAEEGNSWIYKNKDHGMMSAAASLGLSLLWDTDMGLTHIDKYTYSSEEHIKAGALLATGLLNCGVRTEADAALALLGEYVENKSVPLKTSAIMGLGMAYVGSHRDGLLELLQSHIADDNVTMELVSLATLSLGFIFVGSGNGELTGTILQTLMERAEREDKGLDEKWGRFFALGLGLLYLGLQDQCDATLETLKAIEHPLSKTAQIIVEAYDTFQAFAVLGVALIAMGEDIGAEMSLRQFNHLMHYGEPIIRKAVPLAIGLVSASNPVLPILDTLSKYSHDNDLAVALNAIFAMGLMLRQLAGYYHKEPDCLFMVRVAQGMVHMGKGTIGLNPFFSDRSIMSRPAVAGLLATLTAFTDSKGFILDKYHWMLYFLTPAMYPRFLITLDEELKNTPVTVRVGQAVDIVGQAGKPRTISGFQTHQTPVRLGTIERAELATEEFIPFGHVLEGFVVLQKNPGWEKEDKMDI
ncbi:26S proteasome regulatory complex, non-ATPase subcomplex, Rpn1 subunit [Hymenopellis radicata]|nr:26S proteasome regulatory complex, non-ATPase subcomplex, Rpn1 subunit [Hymenopellis radicata]